MLTTEEEAKAKWCPDVRAADDNEASDNRSGGWTGDGEIPIAYRCIGSACMMWRWHWAGRNDLHEHVTTPEGDKLGYCGKGGKP